MSECPDPKCREDLISRINTKVSRTALITIVCSIIGVSGYFIGYGLAADSKQKAKIVKNTQDIAVIKKDIEHIKDAVKRIETNQMSKQELIETIKKAIKGR